VNRLDNEYSAFLRSQELYGDNSKHVLEVSCATPLRKYIDPGRLRVRLDRVQEMKLTDAQGQYLGVVGQFTPEYLKWLNSNPWPRARVLVKGNGLKVKVEGTLAELILWEAPISIHLHDLYYVGIFTENELNADMIVAEGTRRLLTKMDLLRNSGVRFTEAGTRYRYGFDWQSLVLQVLIGDGGELLLGTTNALIAMSYGLKPVAHGLTDSNLGAMLDTTSIGEIEGMLEEHPEFGPGSIVVRGINAFEMAHLHSHFGDVLSFEWGADLTADMGPAGRSLPLSFSTT